MSELSYKERFGKMIFDYIEENGYVILSKEKFQALEKEKEELNTILDEASSDPISLRGKYVTLKSQLQKLKEMYYMARNKPYSNTVELAEFDELLKE